MYFHKPILDTLFLGFEVNFYFILFFILSCTLFIYLFGRGLERALLLKNCALSTRNWAILHFWDHIKCVCMLAFMKWNCVYYNLHESTKVSIHFFMKRLKRSYSLNILWNMWDKMFSFLLLGNNRNFL